MGEALRKMRRKGKHQNLEAENIELRKALENAHSAVGQLHMTMLRFALGSNWVARLKRSHWFWKSQWFWEKELERAPEYIWVGAGNPEKAAHDVMVACFGKDYQAQAAAALAAVKKQQEEKDASVNSLVGGTSLADSVRRGE